MTEATAEFSQRRGLPSGSSRFQLRLCQGTGSVPTLAETFLQQQVVFLGLECKAGSEPPALCLPLDLCPAGMGLGTATSRALGVCLGGSTYSTPTCPLGLKVFLFFFFFSTLMASSLHHTGE